MQGRVDPLRTRSLFGFGSASLVFVLGVFGALAAIATETGAWSPPEALPRAFALVGLAVVLVVAFALVHVLTRKDLVRRERALLGVSVVVVPLGAFVYLALGPERTRALARRLLALADPEPAGVPGA